MMSYILDSHHYTSSYVIPADTGPPPSPPDNVVTYNDDPVTYDGQYMTYGA